MAVLDHGFIDHLGNEAQGPFGADHQVLHDVEGVGKIDERVEAVAGGVFDLELVADTVGQLLVRQHLSVQRGKPIQQMAVAAPEIGPAFVVRGIDHASVNHDDAHRIQGLVAVLLHPAAHAAGIISKDTADLGAVD